MKEYTVVRGSIWKRYPMAGVVVAAFGPKRELGDREAKRIDRSDVNPKTFRKWKKRWIKAGCPGGIPLNEQA